MTMDGPGVGYDMLFETTRRRAARGDKEAARAHLVWLIHALREAHGMVLTPRMRQRLAETLTAIYMGADANDAFFVKPGSGTKKWEMAARNAKILREMNHRIGEGEKPWAIAGDLADRGIFCDKDGKPLKQKRIERIWRDFKDDPDFKIIFEGPSFPTN